MDKEILIDGKKVKVTNLEKVYWPEEGYTKGDLIDYYRKISGYILPYLKGRPESLHRFPNGYEGGRFYQKNVEVHPEWVRTHKVWSGSTNEFVNYVICDDEATLVYLANLGCIEMNVWNSSEPHLDKPDYLVIDLDPEDIDYDVVIETALEVKKVFDSLGVKSYVKTSGASGMHIYAPTGAKYTFAQVRDFAHIVVSIVHNSLPEKTSIERHPEKRQKKVYLDYLQNNPGATMASPYSVRPVTGATVSMPLEWKEVKSGLTPSRFDIRNAPGEIRRRKGIFRPVLSDGIDLAKALEKLK